MHTITETFFFLFKYVLNKNSRKKCFLSSLACQDILTFSTGPMPSNYDSCNLKITQYQSNAENGGIKGNDPSVLTYISSKK